MDWFKKQLNNFFSKTRAQTHLFILSAPRSGSTWLQTALNNHPEIVCTENRFFGGFCEVWPDGNGKSSPRITLDRYVDVLSSYFNHEALGLSRESLRKELLQRYIDLNINLALRSSGKVIFADKITPYHDTSEKVLNSIYHYFPEAKVVQLVRDGRDVATSGVFDWLEKNGHGKPRYDYFVQDEISSKLERFFDDEALHEWAKYWFQPIEAFQKHSGQFLTIKYEDMKTNQQNVLGEILHYTNAKSSTQLIDICIEKSSFIKMSGGRKAGEGQATAKVRRGVVGDWKNYFTRRDGELFNTLAGQHLLTLGYETDPKWYENLPESLSIRGENN
jgi:hypothetical protein